ARFPQWPTELLARLDCHRLVEAGGAGDPEALKEFEILAELGKGAQGSLYLAKQHSLGLRPVVLKITACHGREHLSLARLQHTHIMPLYEVQNYPTRNLRLLCMPYFGGASLARLLEILKDRPHHGRTGHHPDAAPDRVQPQE